MPLLHTLLLANIILGRMFIGPCIIVIVEELKTNLMSLVIFTTLIICSTCFEHYYVDLQEPATVLMDYHIGYLVL